MILTKNRELGELIGNATSNKSGLMSSGMVPLELSKDNNQYCKISVFMPNAGSINESVISVTNVGGDSFSVAVSMIRWNANKVFCKLINGTKISNINMYYTVDTERFCFYIKANWYAKIIVSRLGLVNTSKIESINAIPSGAIEVPISWRDKRYSTDLGELLPTASNEKKGLMPAGWVSRIPYFRYSSDNVYKLEYPFYGIVGGHSDRTNTTSLYVMEVDRIYKIYATSGNTISFKKDSDGNVYASGGDGGFKFYVIPFNGRIVEVYSGDISNFEQISVL